jgi:hypothetical protein
MTGFRESSEFAFQPGEPVNRNGVQPRHRNAAMRHDAKLKSNGHSL